MNDYFFLSVISTSYIPRFWVLAVPINTSFNQRVVKKLEDNQDAGPNSSKPRKSQIAV